MCLDPVPDLPKPLVPLPDVVPLGKVDAVYDGLGGDELELVLDDVDLGVGEGPAADGGVALEEGPDFVHGSLESVAEGDLGFPSQSLLLSNALRLLLDRGLEHAEVLKAELADDGLEVPYRVYGIVDVDDLVGLERPNDVEYPVHGRDVGEEGVS